MRKHGALQEDSSITSASAIKQIGGAWGDVDIVSYVIEQVLFAATTAMSQAQLVDVAAL